MSRKAIKAGRTVFIEDAAVLDDGESIIDIEGCGQCIEVDVETGIAYTRAENHSDEVATDLDIDELVEDDQ